MAKCVAVARRCASHTEWNTSSVQYVGPPKTANVVGVVAERKTIARAARNVTTGAKNARAAKYVETSAVNARAVSTANVC